jgi:uncharacterized cupin superfamily protein
MDLETYHQLASMQLGSFKPKPTTLTPGQTEASITFWKSPDGRERTGVWECTPGRFTADRSKETELCYIISGKAALRRADGEVKTIGPGDVLILPRGWRGEWEIIETTRKFFSINAAD